MLCLLSNIITTSKLHVGKCHKFKRLTSQDSAATCLGHGKKYYIAFVGTLKLPHSLQWQKKLKISLDMQKLPPSIGGPLFEHGIFSTTACLQAKNTKTNTILISSFPVHQVKLLATIQKA